MPDAIPGVRLFEVVREDAVATVLRAEDASTGEPLAVRRLHRSLADDEAARLLFAEEVRRTSGLSHPFLLKVKRADPKAPVPYAVTEPVHGETLEAARARAPFPPAESMALLHAFLDACRVLEGRKQFHAAPLPSRIVRVGDGWRLLTFRDVRAEDESLRMKGRPPADPRFAPPEVAEAHPASVKARSLTPWWTGALWLFLVTGRGPAEADPSAAPLDPAAKAVLAKFLDRQPIGRPHGAETTRALLSTADPSAAPPARPAGTAPVAPRRRPA